MRFLWSVLKRYFLKRSRWRRADCFLPEKAAVSIWMKICVIKYAYRAGSSWQNFSGWLPEWRISSRPMKKIWSQWAVFSLSMIAKRKKTDKRFGKTRRKRWRFWRNRSWSKTGYSSWMGSCPGMLKVLRKPGSRRRRQKSSMRYLSHCGMSIQHWLRQSIWSKKSDRNMENWRQKSRRKNRPQLCCAPKCRNSRKCVNIQSVRKICW